LAWTQLLAAPEIAWWLAGFTADGHSAAGGLSSMAYCSRWRGTSEFRGARWRVMKTRPLSNRVEIEFNADRQPEVEALAAIGKDTMRGDFLPRRNEKASSRMSPCAARSSHLYRAKFIPQPSVNRRTIIFTDSGNDAGSVLNGNGK
jgi:hypothetical protein